MLVINQHNCYIIMNVVKYPLLYLLFAEVVCHVTSTSPHRIVIGPEETLAYNGETVVMKCTVASGLPTWFRVVPGGTDIELSDGTSAANPYQIVGDQSSGEYFLQIPNVQVSDSHTYQCALFNANPAYIQASLTVIDTVPSCSVTGSITGNKVKDGDTVSLQCSATQGVPPAVLVWLQDGVVQYTGTTSQTEIHWITAIEREDDGELYKCSLQHSTLTNDISCQSVIQFDVEYDPVISVIIDSGNNQGQIKENNDFVATCVVNESHPAVDSYSWSGPGAFIGNGSTLSLSDIKRSSHGSYTCRARNTFHDGSQGIGTTQINVDVQYPPESVSTNPEFIGKIVEGSDFTATCSATGNPTPSYTWEKPSGTLKVSGMTLNLNNINRNLAGVYICKAVNTLHDSSTPSDTSSLTVDVQYPPELTSITNASNGKVIEGRTFIATCSAAGNPTPSYTWEKPSGTLIQSEKTLTLSNINKNEAGDYICKAVNTLHDGTTPSDTSSVMVDVQYVPAVSVTAAVTIVEGETLSLNCTVDANPYATVKWTTPSNIDLIEQTFILPSINRIKSGVYTCSATNIFYNSQQGHGSSETTVDVQYPPESTSITNASNGKVIEGRTFIATCSAAGNPTPSYTWEKPSGTLIQSEKTLTLSNINKNEAGDYICKAVNTLHDGTTLSDTSSVMVDVQYVPAVSVTAAVTIVEGETLSLNCTVDANPYATVKWTTPSNIDLIEQTFILPSINRIQSGVYTCSATNIFYNSQQGHGSSETTVDVQYLPTVISETTFAGEIGEPAIMNLTVDANPSSTSFSEWVNGNLTLSSKTDTSSSSSVYIDELTEDYFGFYSITASNSVGDVIIQIELKAVGPPEPPNEILILETGYEQLTVKIIPGFHGGDAINILYYLQYNLVNNATDKLWPEDGKGSVNEILTVTGLNDNTTYKFRAYASSSFGDGDISNTFSFKTYGIPTIELNPENGELTWTRHENGSYQCVKIEKYVDDSWVVIEECVLSSQLEYTVDDVNAEYRVTYCTLDGDHCLEESIDAVKHKVPVTNYEMTMNGMLITCGVLIIIDIVLIILISRRKPQNNGDAEMVCSYSGADNPSMVTSEIMRTSPPKGMYSNEKPSTSLQRKRPMPAAAATSLDIDDVYVQENKQNQVHGKAKNLKTQNINNEHSVQLDGALYANLPAHDDNKAHKNVASSKQKEMKPSAIKKTASPPTTDETTQHYDDVPVEHNDPNRNMLAENMYEVTAGKPEPLQKHDTNIQPEVVYADLDQADLRKPGNRDVKRNQRPPPQDKDVPYGEVDFVKTERLRKS